MEDFKIVFDVDDKLLSQLIELDKTVYDEINVGNFEQCKSFLSVNPDIYTVLMLNEKPIGYISFYPLKDDVYLKFKAGVLKDYSLNKNDILNFNEPCGGYLLSSIVIAKEFQNTAAITHLLSGFKCKLEQLNVINGSLLFDCVSIEGETLAKTLFQSKFIVDSSGGKIFEGDISTFLSGHKMVVTQKAGCFLVDVKHKKIALVFREKQQDWTFPKGHLEVGETLKECAVRETAEETKRTAEIVETIEPIVETYVTPAGEKCKCYMFVAVDNGKSDNASADTHATSWFDVEKIEEQLSYESLKQSWRLVKDKILTCLNN